MLCCPPQDHQHERGAQAGAGPSFQNADKERLTVDIGALKQQYSKLRQRQKQAQVILTSECPHQIEGYFGELLAKFAKLKVVLASSSPK